MWVCSFTNCHNIASEAVDLICCNLLACLSCATPGFYEGPKKCPSCCKTITEEDFVQNAEVRRKVEPLRKKWKDKILSSKEIMRLKEVTACNVCQQPCSKAVSLACCRFVSCRKCALDMLRQDNTKCWSCGELSEDVITPSQLNNNYLARNGVTFLNENQPEMDLNKPMYVSPERRSATFEIFVLLHHSENIHGIQKAKEAKSLSESEQAQLQKLLMRNKTEELELDGEPMMEFRPEVRDIFTGSGQTSFNKKLAKAFGKESRKFDGTSIQRYRPKRKPKPKPIAFLGFTCPHVARIV